MLLSLFLHSFQKRTDCHLVVGDVRFLIELPDKIIACTFEPLSPELEFGYLFGDLVLDSYHLGQLLSCRVQ